MSLAPLLSASPAIQIHALAALAAFVLGGIVLFRRKGDRPHRRLGGLWVGLMTLVAVSSFFIWEIRMVGLFSPIHLLSAATLVSLWQAVVLARKRKIKAHMRTMQALYMLALVVTGWFTFMPGRIMNKVLFGSNGAGIGESAAFLFASILVGAVVIWLVRRAGRPPSTGKLLPSGAWIRTQTDLQIRQSLPRGAEASQPKLSRHSATGSEIASASFWSRVQRSGWGRHSSLPTDDQKQH